MSQFHSDLHKMKGFSSTDLEATIVAVTRLLPAEITVFPFFGSLLGYTREGRPVEGDDDIDLFVRSQDFWIIVSTVVHSPAFEIQLLSSSAPFLLFRSKTGPKVPIAIHGYWSRRDSIVDRWNFSGLPRVGFLQLRVAKKLLFPLEYRAEFGLWMPAHPERLCRYLYGRNWRTPQTKSRDYKAVALIGQPVRLYGRAARVLQQTITLVKRIAKDGLSNR